MSVVSATAMRVRPGRWRVRLGPPGRYVPERFVFRRRSARRLLEKYAAKRAGAQ